MKCPSCSFEVKTLNELIYVNDDVPWYKFTDEKTQCPECKTEVKVIMPKYMVNILKAILVIYLTLLFVAIIFSIQYLTMFLSILVIVTPLFTNHVLRSIGVLVERNT